MRFAFLFITLVVASTFAAVQNIQGSYQSKAGGQRKQNVFQSYSTNFSCFLRKIFFYFLHTLHTLFRKLLAFSV